MRRLVVGSDILASDEVDCLILAYTDDDSVIPDASRIEFSLCCPSVFSCAVASKT